MLRLTHIIALTLLFSALKSYSQNAQPKTQNRFRVQAPTLKEFENWSKKYFQCGNSQFFERKRLPILDYQQVTLHFVCQNGWASSGGTFKNSNGDILFQTGTYKGAPSGFALYYSEPKQLFVWKNGRLVPWNQIPTLPEDYNPTKDGPLSGEYIGSGHSSQPMYLFTLKEGILNGALGVHSVYGQNQSVSTLHYFLGQLPVDQNINPHPEYITTSPTPAEAFAPQQGEPAYCSRSIISATEDVIDTLEKVTNDQDAISWTRKPESRDFRSYFQCKGKAERKVFRQKNGLVSVIVECSDRDSSGNISIFSNNSGKKVFQGEVSGGLPNGQWIYYFQGSLAGKIHFQNGQIQEVCRLGVDIKAITDSERFAAAHARNTSLWLLTTELATRQKSTAGIAFSPNFSGKDGGAAGYYSELEYLRLDSSSQWRVSAGGGFFAFFYIGHASLGMRFENNKYHSLDATVGMGLGLISGFARAIYSANGNSLNGEVGLKLFVPLNLL